MKTLRCGRFSLPLDRPLVMGIVNLTPDSFSGDGIAGSVEQAIAHARRQWLAGADILDVGAESTRPGAAFLPAEEELRRLLPVLKVLADWDVPVSVDTCKPEVMQAVCDAGASMINDIRGMRDPAALEAVAGSACAVCVMHMQGEPKSMQQAPVYGEVVAEVRAFLEAAVARCLAAGIAPDRLVIDPGFGFGKTLQHNLALFRSLADDARGDFPVLVGVSRKSMLGEITGRPVGERQAASVAAALLAAQRGAGILRVHDVAATVDALRVWQAIDRGE